MITLPKANQNRQKIKKNLIKNLTKSLIDDLSISSRTLQSQQELDQLLALLNEGFNVPPAGCFYDDFPVWDVKHGLELYKIGAFLEGQLLSSISVRIAQLKTNSGTVPVGLMGAVVTHPKYRGQGLVSKLIPMALEWAHKQGAKDVFLWGGEHSLYSKFGFDLCGEQFRVPLENLPQPKMDLPVSRGWAPLLFECLKERRYGLCLSDRDYFWISAHKNVDWWWIGNEKKIRAYAALGRGIDLQGLIHEWGGEREALFYLLSEIRKKNSGLELLGSAEAFKGYNVSLSLGKKEFLALGNFFGLPLEPLWFWGLDSA